MKESNTLNSPLLNPGDCVMRLSSIKVTQSSEYTFPHYFDAFVNFNPIWALFYLSNQSSVFVLLMSKTQDGGSKMAAF